MHQPELVGCDKGFEPCAASSGDGKYTSAFLQGGAPTVGPTAHLVGLN